MDKKYANVGGQAVMEGIMMKSPKKSVLAVRDPSGNIVTEEVKDFSIRKKCKLFRLPIIRGIFAFIESMVVGYKSIMRSAELSGLEEETDGNKFVQTLIMAVAVVLGVLLAVGLFVALPLFCMWAISFVFDFGIFKTLIEGAIRVVIFLLYIVVVSRQKDIKRIFEYHGAEHKTIFCFEAREELTYENVKKQSRLHPRCGTSFIFLVMIISILFFSFVTWDNYFVRFALKLLLMPVVAGVSFELIQLAGKYDNVFTRIISAPGKALQKITTSEPDEGQIEVAIKALEESLRNDEGVIDPTIAYGK